MPIPVPCKLLNKQDKVGVVKKGQSTRPSTVSAPMAKPARGVNAATSITISSSSSSNPMDHSRTLQTLFGASTVENKLDKVGVVKTGRHQR